MTAQPEVALGSDDPDGANRPERPLADPAQGARARWVHHVGDLLTGSDPGLARLRMAASGAGALGSALGVEYLFAQLRGLDPQATLIAMLLGAIVAMIGSMALAGDKVWPKVRVGAFFPVALGAGVVPGIAVGRHTDVMLVVFVVVMFVAVFVRRFGLPFFFYGFMAWIGYFFASFLGATWTMLPGIVLDAVIGTVWVIALSATVLRTNPGRTLAHVQRSFGARSRSLAAVCLDLLQADPTDDRVVKRARHRLVVQQHRLAEAALMIEALSADENALPEGWSARSLRRRVLDVQLCLDRVAGTTGQLVDADPSLKSAAVEVVASLSRRDHAATEQAAAALDAAVDAARPRGTDGWWPARHLAAAAEQFTELALDNATAPNVDGEADFTPAVQFVMGNLPGSPAIVREVPVRGGKWNPLTRLDFTTRQAVQVAIAGTLAIIFGRELDQTRYYWAVIAAFIAFTGTGTRSETFIKASNRVLGTLVGLSAGIAVANLTAGHTYWILVVIVGSMFCGFYLIKLSYAFMIFFITIMVSELYSVFHEFSDGLLVLRLEETAIGAAVGIGVALLVAPLSTRDSVASSRNTLFDALADLLDGAAQRLEGAPTDAAIDLDALQRGLDNRLREVLQVSRPLTRPLVWDNSPRRTRRTLTLYTECVSACRTVTAALRESTSFGVETASACRALAGAARTMALAPLGAPGDARASAAHLVTDADTALFSADAEPATRAGRALRRELMHLDMLMQEVVEPGSSADELALTPPTHAGLAD